MKKGALKMAGNASLNRANKNKKDEFYTQLPDIENELKHYRKHFAEKTVLCNCDDPFESNFFKFFCLNFNRLKLKKLIATSYSGSPITGEQLALFGDDTEQERKTPYKAIVTEVSDANGDGQTNMIDVAELFKSGKNSIEKLEGSGDFRSPECQKLLDEADIVVTNPPFSLFREYMTNLMQNGKKFIVIGSQNGIKYKEVFPHFMHNELWLGYNFGDMSFQVPPDYEPRETRYWVDKDGQKWRSLGNICWYTNLDIKKLHEELPLAEYYKPEEYPKYVKYDAIEVSKVADIPCDYAGYMGVPITFMDKYNPDQFEIIGMNWTVLANATLSDDIRRNNRVARRLNFYLPFPDGNGNNYSRIYDRIVIRNKHPEPPRFHQPEHRLGEKASQ